MAELHVGYPNLPDRDFFDYLIGEIWANNRLTNDGPLVRSLEHSLENRFDVKHVVCVANGTLALMLVFKALELRGNIVMPSYTFPATAHAACWQGLDIRFADIVPGGVTADPESVRRRITNKTAAICGVHTYGEACEVEALRDIADRHHIKLIYDAAHAFDCTHGGKSLMAYGDAVVCSFHATKVFSTVEGGAICTDDTWLAEKLRALRNFGYVDSEMTGLGINAKMSELHAAYGIAMLYQVGRIEMANKMAYQSYCGYLAGHDGVKVLPVSDDRRRNYHYMVVEADDRDGLHDYLRRRGILARKYFSPPVHRMRPYKFEPQPDLPHTDRLASRVLALPTGPSVDVGLVCKTIVEYLSR